VNPSGKKVKLLQIGPSKDSGVTFSESDQVKRAEKQHRCWSVLILKLPGEKAKEKREKCPIWDLPASHGRLRKEETQRQRRPPPDWVKTFGHREHPGQKVMSLRKDEREPRPSLIGEERQLKNGIKQTAKPTQGDIDLRDPKQCEPVGRILSSDSRGRGKQERISGKKTSMGTMIINRARSTC